MLNKAIGRRLTDLTSAEVSEAIANATIIWPVGSTEQHGPHLPLSVDVDIAEGFATAVAAELGRAYVAPAQSISARSLPGSGGGLSFPGTIYLGGASLVQYFEEVIAGLIDLGCERLVIINGHYENEAFLFEAVDACRCAGRLQQSKVLAFSWWSLVDQGWLDREMGELFPGWHAEHAGVTETSLMLHLRPDLVRPQRPTHATPPPFGIYFHPVDLAKTTTDGVLSSTSGASAELGASLFEHVTEAIVHHIKFN